MRNQLKILVIFFLCLPLSVLPAEKNDHIKYVQHVEQGFVFLFQGNNKEAIAAFESALAVEPKHYEILHYLGVAYAQEKFWNKAVEVYKRSLDLKPDNIEALHSLSLVYFKLNQWAEAIEPLRKVITLSPQHARGHELLGKVYLKLRQFSDAANVLTRAIELKPDAAGTYNDLGTVYLNLKDYPQAIENFTKALKFGPPRYAEPHHGLGTAYLRIGDREKSVKEMQIYQQLQEEFAEYERFSRLTRTEPNNLEAWKGLANVLIRQKKYNEVVPVFQKCIEIASKQRMSADVIASFYHGLSQAFINLNYPKHAQESVRKAIQLAPNVAVFYNTLGSTYAMLGDVRNAIPAFRKAIELDGEQPHYHLNLSKLYQSIGNHKLAKEHHQAYQYFLSKQKKTK